MTLEGLLADASQVALTELPDARDLVDAGRLQAFAKLEALAHKHRMAAGRLAQAVIDMLGEGSLCGYEAPMVLDGPAHARVRIPESWGGAMLSTDETRALAGQLLRAADEADGGAK